MGNMSELLLGIFLDKILYFSHASSDYSIQRLSHVAVQYMLSVELSMACLTFYEILTVGF